MADKKQILITCKEATLLVCKKQEKAISLKEKIQLKAHLLVCRVCQLFNIQSALLHQHLTKINNENYDSKVLQLDETQKAALQLQIDTESEK